MVKQLASRTQRSRGFKVKHVLQICFLLAICFWLLYQVKHSHDKKKEFDEGDARISQQKQSSTEVVKLGRKDLNPRVQDTTATTNQVDEAEEEEENAGEEEIKPEEADLEDKKSEEKDDERRGAGDDDTDEHEEDKSDAEVDHEEDVIEEEKDKAEGDEKENDEKDSEENDGQLDNERSLDEEHDDDEQAHEAREEHYKADDASSAVTQETEVVAGENGNQSLENSNVVNKTNESSVGGETSGSKVEARNLTENGGPLKTTDKVVTENFESKSDNGYDDHLKLVNSTLGAENVAHLLSTQNETKKEPDFSQAGNATTEGTTSGDGSTMHLKLGLGSNISLSSTENRADSNLSTDSKSREVTNTNNSTLSTMPEKLENSTNEAEDSSGSSFTDTDNAGEAAGSEDRSNDGTDGTIDDASETENTEEFQSDLIDSSDSSIGLQEKEVRTDLETLPEIQIEGSNDDDAAAE